MTIQRGKQVKIVSGTSAADFEAKLNGELNTLNIKGIKYDMQLSPQTGFVAYIVYEEELRIADTIKDEFEMLGETHTCIECPFYTRPIDGRVKYTRCDLGKGICRRDTSCCESFYEGLYNGTIQLVDVEGG